MFPSVWNHQQKQPAARPPAPPLDPSGSHHRTITIKIGQTHQDHTKAGPTLMARDSAKNPQTESAKTKSKPNPKQHKNQIFTIEIRGNGDYQRDPSSFFFVSNGVQWLSSWIVTVVEALDKIPRLIRTLGRWVTRALSSILATRFAAPLSSSRAVIAVVVSSSPAGS
ncbi:hypothetical protein Dimus_021138 [Dionaea muscipula]